MKLILASGSTRRQELLKQLGLKFDVIPSDYEEDMTLDMDPLDLAKHLAYGKAADVASKLEDGLVIGADTFIEFDGRILGKPLDKETARNTLRMISGNTIRAITGLALINAKSMKEVKDVAVTAVKIKNLTDAEIDTYIKTGEPLDKAGGIGVQSRGAVFVEKMNGCHTTVIGLPLNCLYKNLEKFRIKEKKFGLS